VPLVEIEHVGHNFVLPSLEYTLLRTLFEHHSNFIDRDPRLLHLPYTNESQYRIGRRTQEQDDRARDLGEHFHRASDDARDAPG
jgi:hypothetical protein